jgi:exonuclease SbcC
MIPLRLRLHNFMSYGEGVPPLDFSQISTVCLTGDNGHGKSALLDAITWALWGQTRAKNLDDVVRLGQTSTEVEFEFDLDDQRYRVLRKRSIRTRAGQSSLELQGFDTATNRYQSISGNSMRETEAKITQILHMNYETFINSVFVLQGRADEFTTKRPGERKRILADVLGLALFDDLEARARARRNDLDQEVRVLTQRLDELRQEADRKDELAAALTAHQHSLSQTQAALQEAQGRLDTLRQRQSTLALQHQRVQDINSRLQQLRQELLDVEQQLQAHDSRIADYEAVLQQEQRIVDGYQTLQRLKEAEGVYGARAQEHAALQQRQSALQQAVTAAQHRLELERQGLTQRLHTTDDALHACEAILQQAPRITRDYEALQAARQRDAQLSQALQQRYRLEQQKNRIEQRIQQQRHALELEQRSLLDRQTEWQQKEAALPNWQRQVDELGGQLATVEQRLQRLDQVRTEGVSLKVQIEQHIPQSVDTLQQEIAEQRQKRSLLSAAEAHCPLCEQPLRDAERRRVIQKLAQEVARREERIGALQIQQRQLQERRTALRSEYKQLEQQVEQRKQLEQQYAAAQASLADAMRARDDLAVLLGDLQRLDAQITSGNYAADDMAGLQRLTAELASVTYDAEEHQTVKQGLGQLASVEGERARLQQAEADQTLLLAQKREIAEQLTRLEQALAEQRYAMAEQAELRTLAERLASLDFDPAHYRSLRQQLQEQQHFERQHVELEAAREHLGVERTSLQRLEARRQRCATDLATLEQERQQYARDVETLEDLQSALQETDMQVSRLREGEGELRMVLGRTQSQYDHCVQRQAELQQRTVQRDQLAEERSLYGDLVQMFGKNGIQALIIENAIPELEDEANRILGRITGNTMHLTLETQRDTRSGTVAETLDIKISDTLGTRNYEMFSGGEAFRINFALRIALSKMLARRAGTRLRTLVIDEGFGSQDTQGLERLVEVIKAIQDDFAKIIVITHLRELKNAFDTHIEVRKDPVLGSLYQVA